MHALMAWVPGVWRGYMRKLFLILLILSANTAFAVPVEWTLQDVNLEGGMQITGSFTFDADAPDDNCTYGGTFCWSSGYSDFDLYINDAWDFSPEAGAWVDLVEYGPGPSGPMDGAFNLQVFCCAGEPQELPNSYDQLLFWFDEELTNEGGVVGLNGYLHLPQLGNALIGVTGGTLVASVVPLPATVWLFLSALAGLGLMRRSTAVGV